MLLLIAEVAATPAVGVIADEMMMFWESWLMVNYFFTGRARAVVLCVVSGALGITVASILTGFGLNSGEA